jgi:hypothetical protein
MAWPWLGHEVVYVTGRVEFGFEEERGRLGVLEVAELGQAHLERRHVGQRFAQQPGRLQPPAHNASRTLVAQSSVEEKKRKKRKEKGEKNSTSGKNWGSRKGSMKDRWGPQRASAMYWVRTLWISAHVSPATAAVARVGEALRGEGNSGGNKEKKKKNVRGGMMLMTHWLLGDLVKVEGCAVVGSIITISIEVLCLGVGASTELLVDGGTTNKGNRHELTFVCGLLVNRFTEHLKYIPISRC